MGEDILIYVVLLIDVTLLGISGMLVMDRVRVGYNRAEEQLREEARRHRSAIAEVDRVAAAVEEQRSAITTSSRIVGNLRAEVTILEREAETEDKPFIYSVTATSGADFYAPIWRFIAKHPDLGEGCSSLSDPASQWILGRPYVVAAPTQTEARSLVDRMLPRNRGFTVEADGQGFNVRR